MNQTQGGNGCLGVTSRRTLAAYIVSLAAIILIAVAGPLTGNAGELIITVPVIIILTLTIFSDKEFVHIPPAMILIMIATFLVAAVARFLNGELMNIVAFILWGVNLGMIGIICVFMLRGTVSGISVRDSKLVLPVSVSIAMSIFVLTAMLQHYVSMVWEQMNPVEIDTMMDSLVMVLVGSLVVGLLYMSERTQSLFERTVDSFLEENSDKCVVEDRRRRMVLDTIKEGESDRLEFKSTLRTNLKTGETDKRMEKAVLKSIVAFLNTDGGTLMVGVADDGSICGIDLESFENKDKLNLHFTHMLDSSIGNEYLPYIKFHLIDFPDGEGGEKSVLRVTCYRSRKPVFLKEGKNEIFYVRSGPSSIELTGMNLVNYVKNRSRKTIQDIKETEEE